MAHNEISRCILHIDQLFYFFVQVAALPTPPKIFLVDFTVFAATAGMAQCVTCLLFKGNNLNPFFSLAVRALTPNEFRVKPGVLTNILSAKDFAYFNFFFRFVHYHLPPQVI
jgi:hypothetical protein